MNAFVFYLALGIAAGGQMPAEAPKPQPLQEKPVRPKLSPPELSELKNKAEKGDASAEFALGMAFEEGNGVSRNDEAAARWYRKAADQGNATAENRLGIMYRLGQGVPPDKEEAVRWYHKAAMQGDPQAMFNLGASYYNGDGVASSLTLAYSWFLLAQDAGNLAAVDAVKRSSEENGGMRTPDALMQVAAMYEKGIDLPQNYSEAAKWYRKSADKIPEAAFRLATLYVDGRGVPQDYGQAMSLCRGAAKPGYEPAQFCIGFLYQRGLGTAVNPKEAAKWYELASKYRYRPAMMALADMYWKGEGVPVDRPKAYCLFYLASQEKIADARTKAQTLLKEMTKDDVKHLEKKLRDLQFDPQKVFASMQDRTTPSTGKESPRP